MENIPPTVLSSWQVWPFTHKENANYKEAEKYITPLKMQTDINGNV